MTTNTLLKMLRDSQSLAISLVYFPLNILAYGYVLSLVWGWYVVDVFDLDPITWWQSFGLAAFLALCVPDNVQRTQYEVDAADKDQLDHTLYHIKRTWAQRLVILFLAWAVHAVFASNSIVS